MIMDRLYGGVCYAGIDTDPELKYPKGAGRVAFSNQQSYIAAISARFVQLQHNDIDKRVEVKPYVLDDQMCDECQGTRCGGKFAPFFCANVTCLQYYCEYCWASIHSRAGREFHKPLVKEGGDRPRHVPFRWSWAGGRPSHKVLESLTGGKREDTAAGLTVFWKSVHLFSIFKEEMGLFIIIIIYSHITELNVQYNAKLQSV